MNYSQKYMRNVMLNVIKHDMGIEVTADCKNDYNSSIVLPSEKKCTGRVHYNRNGITGYEVY